MVVIRQGYLVKKGALTNMWAKRWFFLHVDGTLSNCKQPSPFYTVGSSDPESREAVDKKAFGTGQNLKKNILLRENANNGPNLGALSEILSAVGEGSESMKRLNVGSCDVVNEIGEKGGRFVIRIHCTITNRMYWIGSSSRQEIQEWLWDILYVRKTLQRESHQWKKVFKNLEKMPVGSLQANENLKMLPNRDWFKEWRLIHGLQPYPGVRLVSIDPQPQYLQLRRKYLLTCQFHLYVGAISNCLIRSLDGRDMTMMAAVEHLGYRMLNWWGSSPLPGDCVCFMACGVAFVMAPASTNLHAAKMLAHEMNLLGFLQQVFNDAGVVCSDQKGVASILPLSCLISCCGYQVMALAMPQYQVPSTAGLPIRSSHLLADEKQHAILEQLSQTLETNLRLEIPQDTGITFQLWASPEVTTIRRVTPQADPFAVKMRSSGTSPRMRAQSNSRVEADTKVKVPVPYAVCAPPFCPPDVGMLLESEMHPRARVLLLPVDRAEPVTEVVFLNLPRKNWTGGRQKVGTRQIKDAACKELGCRSDDLAIEEIDGWLRVIYQVKNLGKLEINPRATQLVQLQVFGHCFLMLAPGCQAPDVDCIQNKTYPYRFRPEFLMTAVDKLPYLGPNEVLSSAGQEELGKLAANSEYLRTTVVTWAAGSLKGGGTTAQQHSSSTNRPSEGDNPAIEVFHGGHLAAVLHQAGVNLRYLPAVRAAVKRQRIAAPSPTGAGQPSPQAQSPNVGQGAADQVQLSKLAECELLGRTAKRILDARSRMAVMRTALLVSQEDVTGSDSDLDGRLAAARPDRGTPALARRKRLSQASIISHQESMLDQVVMLLNSIFVDPGCMSVDSMLEAETQAVTGGGLSGMNPALALKVIAPRVSMGQSRKSFHGRRSGGSRTPRPRFSSSHQSHPSTGSLTSRLSTSSFTKFQYKRMDSDVSESTSLLSFGVAQGGNQSKLEKARSFASLSSGLHHRRNGSLSGLRGGFTDVASTTGSMGTNRGRAMGVEASQLFWEVESRAWLLLGPFGYMGGMEFTEEEAIAPRHLCTLASPLELLPSVLRNTGISLTVQCLKKMQEEARVPELRAGDVDIRYKAYRGSPMTGVSVKGVARIASDMRASMKILYERQVALKPDTSTQPHSQVYEELASKVFAPFAEDDVLAQSRQLRAEVYLANACEWTSSRNFQEAFRCACLGLSCLVTTDTALDDHSVPLDIILASFTLEAALRSHLIDATAAASPASLNWHLQLMWAWRMCQVFFPVSTDGRTLTVWGAHPMIPPLVRFIHETRPSSEAADNAWLTDLLENTLMPSFNSKSLGRRTSMLDSIVPLVKVLQDILKNPQDHVAVMCQRSFLKTILGEQAWYSDQGKDTKSYRSKGRVYVGGLIMGMSNDDAATLKQNAGGATAGLHIPEFSAVRLPAEWTIWKVSCGHRHTALITTTGLLLTFGHGETGRLGHGNEDSLDQPRVLDYFKDHDKAVISVGCGREHTMAVTAAGELYSWGWGECGRLGIGETGVMTTPQHVVEIERLELRALSVACGREHSLIIAEGGLLLACGAGYEGRLGLGEFEDAFVPAIVKSGAMDHENIILASAGDMHTAVLGESGMVYTWGFGQSGALGTGKFETTPLPEPVQSLLTDFDDAVMATSVACGSYHTIVLSATGDVYAFGDGFNGQLGLEDQGNVETQKTAVPRKVVMNHDPSLKAKFISCGPFASSAVGLDGHLYWWGAGEGESEDAPKVLIPSKVDFTTSAPKFQSVSLGGYHTVATTELEEGSAYDYDDIGGGMASLSESLLDIPEPFT